MNIRAWFYLGLSLMGVHLLVEVFITIPGLLMMVDMDLGSKFFMRPAASLLLAIAFKFIPGLFLLLRAPKLANGFVARQVRAAELPDRSLQPGDSPSSH